MLEPGGPSRRACIRVPIHRRAAKDPRRHRFSDPPPGRRKPGDRRNVFRFSRVNGENPSPNGSPVRSLPLLFAYLTTAAVSWAAPADQDPPRDATTPAPAVEQRTNLNLLGQTDAGSGESRRNENIQFNLVDRNLLRDLNTRLGTTATIITEFAPDRGYYGAEYGNQPTSTIHVEPRGGLGIHGRLFESHLNRDRKSTRL